MESSEKETEIPLSYGQQALWLLHNCSPDVGIYNGQFVWEIPDQVDLVFLKKVLHLLVLRHPVIGSIFTEKDGAVVQDVSTPELIFSECHIANVSDDVLVESYLRKELYRPFNLFVEPSVRWIVYHRPRKKRVLALFTQHINSDLWSIVTLFNEFRYLYTELEKGGNPSLSETRRTGFDYLCEQDKFIVSKEGKKQLSYWTNELSDIEPALNLPTDYKRPPTVVMAGISVR